MKVARGDYWCGFAPVMSGGASRLRLLLLRLPCTEQAGDNPTGESYQ
ncbi:MAG: hypothetical protein HY231_09585 [Acidobacteria bacterium]|nr:hypothetical protein [Acidobacteriota bacterium]